MEEGKNGETLKKKNIIFTKTIRAGKRTYFFDVKSTRKNDLYLTITESRKRFNRFRKGFYFEQYKIFLYKEDFDKFENAFSEALEFIRSHQGDEEFAVQEEDDEGDGEEDYQSNEDKASEDYTNVDFEDLQQSPGSNDNSEEEN